MKMLLIIIFVFSGLISFAVANPICEGKKEIVDVCFNIRGRVSISNGTPSVRIWPVGTKRILGVQTIVDEIGDEGETFNGPENLRKWLNLNSIIYADLRVCPFPQDKPGYMRYVCIESANNLRVELFSSDGTLYKTIQVPNSNNK